MAVCYSRDPIEGLVKSYPKMSEKKYTTVNIPDPMHISQNNPQQNKGQFCHSNKKSSNRCQQEDNCPKNNCLSYTCRVLCAVIILVIIRVAIRASYK